MKVQGAARARPPFASENRAPDEGARTGPLPLLPEYRRARSPPGAGYGSPPRLDWQRSI